MENFEKRLEDLEKRVDKNEEGISDLFRHLVKTIKTDIDFHRKFEMIIGIISQLQKLVNVSTMTVIWIAHRLGSK